jgi:hypothetical protein
LGAPPSTRRSRGFDHLDADGDGKLTEHDHVLMGKRVAASLGHPSGSAAEFVQAIIDYWSSTDPAAPGNWWSGPIDGLAVQ